MRACVMYVCVTMYVFMYVRCTYMCLFVYLYVPYADAHIHFFFEGSLEVKLPTIWTDGKEEVVRVREEKSRREKIREEKS